MKIFHIYFTVLAATVSIFLMACGRQDGGVKSPSGNLEITVGVDNGMPYYLVMLDGISFIEDSPLGIVTTEADMSQRLTLENISPVRAITDSYTLPAGKVRNVEYRANERVYTFSNPDGESLHIDFRASDNGVAFRYRIDGTGTTVVESEATGFKLPGHATGFLSPMAKAKTGFAETNPSYEDHYVHDAAHGTPSAHGEGWVFPALFRIGGDGWVLISETGTDGGYAATQLGENSDGGLYRVEFPRPDQGLAIDPVAPTVELPFHSPWRLITVSRDLNGIVTSTLAQDVVGQRFEPSGEFPTGRAAWSWLKLKEPSMNYADQKRFIDFAADMGYEFTLIDALWDTQVGRRQTEELIRYAQSRGVDILLWYNSNGQWNNAPQSPKDLMDTPDARRKEMAWLRDMGVKGIKVDFFAGDKQATIRLYEEILRDANEFGLSVNFHGTTLPRGWDRMFPSFMTAEAVMGMEYITFDQRNADRAPDHCTTLPFTRNVVAPMDFTPVMLGDRLGVDDQSGPRRITTAGFELALPVIFHSPIQHYGVTPESLGRFPDEVARYLSVVPTVWDETVLIDGYPGRLTVMARRSGNSWYVAAINGENVEKEISVSLPAPMTENNSTEYTMISDGENWNTVDVGGPQISDGRLTATLAPYGGFVIYPAE